MDILIKNCLILPMGEQAQIFRGAISIDEQKISEICRHDSPDYEQFIAQSATTVIDGEGMLAMPGLINIHNHASMSLMRSYADDMPLMPWLTEKIWPFEAQLTHDDIHLGAKLGIAEMLLGGTTTFVDMYWKQEAVAEAVIESGIRAVLSPTFVDDKIDEFECDFEKTVSLYGDGKHDRLSLMIAPHAPYSCSTGNLIKARDLAAKHGIGINIHVAETAGEEVTIRERYGKSPIEYIDSLGLLNDKSIAVHCVHLSDSDIEIIRSRGASVAHNPQSNMKLASGISPVAKMLDAGVNVGIGTDGPCSNNDLDMWDEMRSASFLQKVATNDPCVTPAYQILRMATAGGAKAIGREADLGELKGGMTADIILLDMNKPHLCPKHDIVANLVYSGKSSDVDTVIVAGKVVVSEGKVLSFNTREVCRQAEARAQELAAFK